MPVSVGKEKPGPLSESELLGIEMGVLDCDSCVVDGSLSVLLPSGGRFAVSLGFLSSVLAGGGGEGLGALSVLPGLLSSFGLLSVGAGAGFDAGVLGGLSVFSGGGGALLGGCGGLLPGAGFLSSWAIVWPAKRARHMNSKHRSSVEREPLPPEGLMLAVVRTS